MPIPFSSFWNSISKLSGLELLVKNVLSQLKQVDEKLDLLSQRLTKIETENNYIKSILKAEISAEISEKIATLKVKQDSLQENTKNVVLKEVKVELAQLHGDFKSELAQLQSEIKIIESRRIEN